MLSVEGFSQQYPQYSIDFTIPLGQQPRVYDSAILENLPEELASSYEYRSGGRGRPNRNKTLAHSQCATCKRVRRNDFFHAPPSVRRRNGVFTHCLACTKARNAEQYQTSTVTMRKRQAAIWRYLAPQCQLCGFDTHISAMELHHTATKQRETALIALITEVAATANSHQMEKLLHESSCSVALCCNCHRMLHAGALEIDQAQLVPRPYKLLELAKILEQVEVETDE